MLIESCDTRSAYTTHSRSRASGLRVSDGLKSCRTTSSSSSSMSVSLAELYAAVLL